MKSYISLYGQKAIPAIPTNHHISLLFILVVCIRLSVLCLF